MSPPTTHQEPTRGKLRASGNYGENRAVPGSQSTSNSPMRCLLGQSPEVHLKPTYEVVDPRKAWLLAALTAIPVNAVIT
jgi:hypothetical protein